VLRDRDTIYDEQVRHGSLACTEVSTKSLAESLREARDRSIGREYLHHVIVLNRFLRELRLQDALGIRRAIGASVFGRRHLSVIGREPSGKAFRERPLTAQGI
jgi:hypothetical protein